jgi:hypothetical protein
MTAILKNNGTFFSELQRTAQYQDVASRTKIPSVVNTYQNIPQFQSVENISRNYRRSGDAKYKDPFQVTSRPYYDDYDGRKLQIQNTLFMNQQKDQPDIITKYPLKVDGYY